MNKFKELFVIKGIKFLLSSCMYKQILRLTQKIHFIVKLFFLYYIHKKYSTMFLLVLLK